MLRFQPVGAALLAAAIASFSFASADPAAATPAVRVPVAHMPLSSNPLLRPLNAAAGCGVPFTVLPVLRSQAMRAVQMGRRCGNLPLPPRSARSLFENSWTETTIDLFDPNNDFYSLATLIADRAGNLYGTTGFGGPAFAGDVFKLTPPAPGAKAWTETILYSFTGGADGNYPSAGVVADDSGALYGTTQNGGSSGCGGFGCGVVYKLTPAAPGKQWTQSVIHAFSDADAGGNVPVANVILDRRGNVYGTTFAGGDSSCSFFYPGCGAVFELARPATPQTAWNERVLHVFTGGANGDGAGPYLGGLTADEHGNLYGTTYGGGGAGLDAGTVFEVSPPFGPATAWKETILHRFTGGLDGNSPNAGVTIFQDKLFGNTIGGGTNCQIYGGCGIIFALTPPRYGRSDWTEDVIYNFNGNDGHFPAANLVVNRGVLYGTTAYGGALATPGGTCPCGGGTVFALSPPRDGRAPWTENVLYSFSGGVDGWSPTAAVLVNRDRLFGTTAGGGSGTSYNGAGLVYELQPKN